MLSKSGQLGGTRQWRRPPPPGCTFHRRTCDLRWEGRVECNAGMLGVLAGQTKKPSKRKPQEALCAPCATQDVAHKVDKRSRSRETEAQLPAGS